MTPGGSASTRMNGADDEHAATGVLVRSRTEIAHVLEELARDGSVLCAELEGEQLFMSRVLHVDAEQGCFFIGYACILGMAVQLIFG